MSEQFCDDGHYTAQHDRSTNAHGHSAHAGCCDDVSAVQAQLCAVLYVNNAQRACRELGTSTTCSLTHIHDTHMLA